MADSDSCIEICTAPSPTATVIWLHGLGADGNDFAPIVPELQLPDALSIRFLFPHAPVRPVTCNGGYEMRAWYDIFSLEDFAQEDERGLVESQEYIEGLIKSENQRGIPTQRIVLLGFSQGGGVALHAGLRHSQRLAGIGGLSTYLPLRDTPTDTYSQANRDTSIFMAHGRQDPVVRYEHGETSRQILNNMGHSINWNSYDMEHNVCPEEINDISKWLVNCLDSTSDNNSYSHSENSSGNILNN
ncbi:MAG: alpha/beta hydrolase [Ectothiorhodospiraceae bacterium]|nr:alpha/beta hydrolase [Ectothiorhodospiraceae bacterium]